MIVTIPCELNEKLYYGNIKNNTINIVEFAVLKFEIISNENIIIYYISDDGSIGSVDDSEIGVTYFKTYEEAFQNATEKLTELTAETTE